MATVESPSSSQSSSSCRSNGDNNRDLYLNVNTLTILGTTATAPSALSSTSCVSLSTNHNNASSGCVDDRDYDDYDDVLDATNGVCEQDEQHSTALVQILQPSQLSSQHHHINHNQSLSIQATVSTSTTAAQHQQQDQPHAVLNVKKKISPLEWVGYKETSKQGVHAFFDLPSTTSLSCYLSDPEALAFHGLNNLKCAAVSKNERKKRCYLCKLVVHESCIDVLQNELKCRLTYRESSTATTTATATSTASSSLSSSSTSANTKGSLTDNTVKDTFKIQHHWLLRKQENNENLDKKCTYCTKGFTNRFGLQTSSSRTLISCSWCKIVLHLKCYTSYINDNTNECNLGEFNDLIIPPHWIIKLTRKASFHTSFYKTIHRSLKRTQIHHHHHHHYYHHHHHHHNNSHSHNNNNNDEDQGGGGGGGGVGQSSTATTTPSSSTSSSSTNPQGTNNTAVQTQAPLSSSSSMRSFIVRPSLFVNTNLKPLLVFINPKSGGNLGSKILKKFMWLLNPRQIFDLNQPGCAKFALELYRNTPNLRLLVGGGDGTVGWILSIIDQINFIAQPPPIAVLPLGTGNDMSRSLNWGSGYTDEPLTKILHKILAARCVKLDRWKIYTEANGECESIRDETSIVLPDPPSTSTTQGQTTTAAAIVADPASTTNNPIVVVYEKLKNDVMNNYFSIGADAHVCLEFHEKREANPQKFTSRWFNLLQYFEAGSRDQIKQTWKDLTQHLQLECDGKDYTSKIKERGYHCIIFLNISKYSCGTSPWGKSSSSDTWHATAIDDGRLEVIGCFTSTLAKLQIGGAGERICQAKSIKIVTTHTIPIQIDGEPLRLSPSIIEIKHKNQALMLERVKSSVYFNKNVQKSFEIKCILLKDYKTLRKEKEEFRLKSKSFGRICLLNLNENLSVTRGYIENVLKNVEINTTTDTGSVPKKWTFLNADAFYRVQDELDDCVMDIATDVNEIFILDETANNETDTLNTPTSLNEMEMSSDDYDYNSASNTSTNELIMSSIKGNLKIIKQIDNLTQTDKYGMSALHHASLYGHKEIVRYILEKVPESSFVNLVDFTKNQTALHLSVTQKRRAITKMLLKHGANPYIKDKYGNSVFDLMDTTYDKNFKKIFKDYQNESSINSQT